MVRLELLAGSRARAEWLRLSGLLAALHPLLVDEDAADMGFQLRRSGMTIPSTDLLIAAVAARAREPCWCVVIAT